MFDEQFTEVFGAIARSLDHIEQGRRKAGILRFNSRGKEIIITIIGFDEENEKTN